MIRLETPDHWLLLPHRLHAHLAGEFARHWKNGDFSPPDPFAYVLDAVSRHDDSWEPRDAAPELTPEGRPSAFSRELVGTYDAFEDIDLADYLGVRGRATETAAARDPYSAILISMHTVNLLTEQADPSGLSRDDLATLDTFVKGQTDRQQELAAELAARPELQPFLTPEALRRGFEFLQACDSFSLLAGVAYPEPATLRHTHPVRSGGRAAITYTPVAEDRVHLDPWPLDEPEIEFRIPYRRVAKPDTTDPDTFRAAYAAAPAEWKPFTASRAP